MINNFEKERLKYRHTKTSKTGDTRKVTLRRGLLTPFVSLLFCILSISILKENVTGSLVLSIVYSAYTVGVVAVNRKKLGLMEILHMGITMLVLSVANTEAAVYVLPLKISLLLLVFIFIVSKRNELALAIGGFVALQSVIVSLVYVTSFISVVPVLLVMSFYVVDKELGDYRALYILQIFITILIVGVAYMSVSVFIALSLMSIAFPVIMLIILKSNKRLVILSSSIYAVSCFMCIFYTIHTVLS